MSRARLVAVATHPIQYHAPLFRCLSNSSLLDFSVLFAHKPSAEEQGEGFGTPFQWDVDLTAGYRHSWLTNEARRPGVVGFFGCNTPGIRERLRAERPEALLVMGWNSYSYVQATLAASALNVPVLVRGDSQLTTDRGVAKRLLKRLLYPAWLRHFSVCLATGTRAAEYLRHYGARRVEWCPHFVDNAWFAAQAAIAKPRRETVRESWGVSPETFLFLFVGKLEKKKRPDDLLDALARCRAAGLSVEVLMAGAGTLREGLERKARLQGTPVKFAGFVNQSKMPEVYAAADCLVLPSNGAETWGLVVNEAMACGLPVIVSNEVGCAPDLVTSETGAVYDCGDVEALAARMAEVATCRDEARAAGLRAASAVSEFSIDRAANGVLGALRTIGICQ